MMHATYLDNTPDPTSIGHARASVCEREAALVVAHMRQAFEDADRIGRGARVTGETTGRRCEPESLEVHRSELIDWMYRDAADGLASLDYCCMVIAMRTGERCEPDDVREVIHRALDGETLDSMLGWRAQNVTKPQANSSARAPRVRTERERLSDRERYRRKCEAMRAAAAGAGMEVAA